MSNRRYIELYSGNRNRNQYPLQSSFEVPFAPTRQLSSNFQAFDPLCTGPILYKWNSSIITNPPFPPTAPDLGSTTSIINLTSISGILSPVPNYYMGYQLYDGISEYRTINTYNPTTSSFILSTPFSIVPANVELLSPYWPGPTSPDSSSTPGCIYLSSISGNLSSFPNYYVGYQLYDGTEYRTILSYEPSSAKFLLQQPFTAVPVSPATVDLFDPSTSSSIHIPTKDINGNNVRVWSNAYDDCYIVDETLSNGTNIIYASISSYNYVTQIATLDRPLNGFNSGDQLTIRKTLPQEKYILSANPTNNSIFIYYNGMIYNSTLVSIPSGSLPAPGMIVTLPTSEGNRSQNYYAGKYIYNASNGLSDPSNPCVNGGGIYGLYFIKASSYNQTSNLVELLVEHTSIPQVNCGYNSAISSNIQSPSPLFLKTGDVINIVNYIRDNYSPLNYNGSVVSQSENVCYEVSLVSLTLPNVSLRSGSRAAFYPFFYVEFTNTTSPSGSSNSIIYSNSPNSSNALFIAPITDTTQPLNSSFVKIYSNMSQTIKFKPNDSLKFSVYLPDGRPFETVEQDTLSPYAPNGVIQIDAVFGIRRI